MAPWSALRRVACAAVPAMAVLGSPGSAAEVCHNSSGECDEVGLLQQAAGWPGKHRSGGGAPKECEPACKHGGRCLLPIANYCVCNAGWAGKDCGEQEDCTSKPHPHKDVDGQGKCGLGFTAYPYSQAQLWGSAYEGWETCAGEQQSPINIVCLKAKTTSGPKLDTDFGMSSENPDHVVNNGHALEVDGDFGSMSIGGLKYEVQNLHFHSPSEHTINYKHAAMEMHIVNKAANGKLAVIGILFDIGKPNECLEKVLASPAPLAGCENPVGKVDLSCFEEQYSGPWWSYAGSLTTPPCTEGLAWNVMKKRATISKEQLQTFKTRYVSNARPVQPLNGRRVTYNKVE